MVMMINDDDDGERLFSPTQCVSFSVLFNQ